MNRVLASHRRRQATPHPRHRPIALHLRCTTAVLLACGIATFSQRAQATEAACQAVPGPRGSQSVGLVLSGGGARGYAHLGVLKVLEENRIPVDCIAATSMGSVVGGLYASGMTAQEMQNRLGQGNL